jgi:hypothetical protein
VIHALGLLLFLTGAFPLWYAWQANRRTSLLQAVNWAVTAWTIWGLRLIAEESSQVLMLRYLALCLTGCAGIAVLGARRPGVHAWNFVVLGLLAVHLLPVAEGFLTGTGLQLDGFRVFFLAITLAVGALNYLPTRLAGAVLFAALGCGFELARLAGGAAGDGDWALPVCVLWLTLVPWAGFVAVRGQAPAPSAFDQLWLSFRDRYGLVWGQRLREQFNSSARHAGWPVILRWQGLRVLPGHALPAEGQQTEILTTLRALMKRFGPEQEALETPVLPGG